MKTTTRSQACCWHDTYLEGKVNNFAFLNPFTWLQRIPAHPASQSCQMVDNMQLQLCLERPFSNVGGCPVQLDRPRAWLKDGSTATAILTSWTTRTLAFWMYVQGRSFIAQLWYIDLWNWYLDVCGDHLCMAHHPDIRQCAAGELTHLQTFDPLSAFLSFLLIFWSPFIPRALHAVVWHETWFQSKLRFPFSPCLLHSPVKMWQSSLEALDSDLATSSPLQRWLHICLQCICYS